MIGDVEKLGAELRVYVLPDVGVLEHREIEIVEAGARHDVAAGVSEGERLVQHEGIRIEPFCGRVRSCVGIADQVGSIIP